eukprot:403355602
MNKRDHQISDKSKKIKKDKKEKKNKDQLEGVVCFDDDNDDFEVVQNTIDNQTQQKKNKQKIESSDDSDSEMEYQRHSSQFKNIYKETKRGFTISIVVPSSIIDNAQSLELKTYLVGQIAKACGHFGVNEIIVYSNDRQQHMKNLVGDTRTTTTEFFVKNLEYIETPQYLRKALFPRHSALRYTGLTNPLEGPHHLKITEWCAYREGVVINRPTAHGKGSWVNIGLPKDCQVDIQLEEGTRVTVKLNEKNFDNTRYYSGVVVSSNEPTEKLGLFWGYTVRVANKFEDIFDECPFEETGYDLKLGVSEQGQEIEHVDFRQHQNFKHALIFFGGMEGIEGIIEQDERTKMSTEAIKKKFDSLINPVPERGTRTIRTEESILVTMSSLYPKLRAIGLKL